MVPQLNIRLTEAKRSIALPDFKRDDLLKLALTDLSTLQLPAVTEPQRQAIVLQYRRLAFLGDRLLDAVLADYLFTTHPELTNQDLDDWRQDMTCRESLTEFAIDLGLPEFCSSWNRLNRKPPEEEPGVYGEMFEALVAVIYLDGNRNFQRLYDWLCDRFIQEAVESNGTISTREYLDMIGLDDFFDYGWAPGDDDD